MLLATFDTLYLIDKITQVAATRTGDESAGAADLEIQSLSYFASVLYSWRHEAPWGYDFYVTKDAQPFATEISNALRILKARGAIDDTGVLSTATATGRQLLKELLRETAPPGRSDLLDAALATARFSTLPLVVRAIALDPTLRRSAMSRPLLDDGALGVLSEYLDAAQEVMADNFNLRVLAELLVNYFLLMGNKDER